MTERERELMQSLDRRDARILELEREVIGLRYMFDRLMASAQNLLAATSEMETDAIAADKSNGE